MKGILGKKLGMSQVFDPDSGVMTAVTVIEAGPCPVVQVKTADADGYDAVQLAFEAVAERKLSKAEIEQGSDVTVTLTVTNEGRLPHTLRVRRGARVYVQVSAQLPGERATVTARLPRGKYRMLCSIGNHEELGMYGTLVVR